MARRQELGLYYFPLDVTFFSDKKIKILKSRHGSDGVLIYMYILCEIYKLGYYAKYDEDFEDVLLDDLNVSTGTVQQVLKFLIERSLLDSKLFNSDNILTSTGIQKQYQKSMQGKAVKTPIIVKRYWLLEKEETKAYIKFAQNANSSEKKANSSEKKDDNSEKKETNKRKENKSKLNKSKTEKETVDEPPLSIPEPTKAEIKNLVREELFETVWQLFPQKRGKSAVTKKAKDDLVKTGIDDIKLAIERYKHELSVVTWKNAMNGSTFFNGRYKDYLAKDYQPPKKQTSKPVTTNKFHNFEQREYDYDAMIGSLIQ